MQTTLNSGRMLMLLYGRFLSEESHVKIYASFIFCKHVTQAPEWERRAPLVISINRVGVVLFFIIIKWLRRFLFGDDGW